MSSLQLPKIDATHCTFVLVEDDRLMRELLRDAVQRRFRPRALLEFETGTAALEHCRREPPDVLLTDLRLPDCDGRDLIRNLRALGVQLRVLVMSGLRDGVLAAELLALGVAGFVDKASSLEDYERALRRVLEGGMYFAAGMAPRATAVFGARTDMQSGTAAMELSEQEREIARLVAGGLTSKEIGVQLQLGTRTVEKLRARLMEKVGARDLAGLLRWCLRNGLG